MNYLESLEAKLCRAEKSVDHFKQEINSEKMRVKERSRFWRDSNAPKPNVKFAMQVIGDHLNQLDFDELPRRIVLGHCQFKFVSREVK